MALPHQLEERRSLLLRVAALSAEPSLEQLLQAWQNSPPPKPKCTDVVTMLTRRFHAYEVPVNIFTTYEADEDVTAEDVWKLFFITNPKILTGLIDPQAFDQKTWPPTSEVHWPPFVDELPEIFGNTESGLQPVEDIGQALFNTLTSRGEALGVLLETRDGLVVDGFKVFGGTLLLSDVLLAHVGWQKYARSQTNPQGIAIGDISDEDFARYLRMAHAEGLLSPDTGYTRDSR